MSYDSLQRHLAIEKLVTLIAPNGQEKKYYRIKPARWYSGIVTADCVGCGLLCGFCWVSDNVMFHSANVGRFYNARQIAESLVASGAKLQLKALQNLVNAGASCHPSVMASFSSRRNLHELTQRLKQISSSLTDELEIKELILYPHVIRKLEEHKLKYHTAHNPEQVPPEQI